MRFRTHGLCNTSAMLYQLSYEASLKAGLSSYNGHKLNSLLTCFQRGFIAQMVEHHMMVSWRSWDQILLTPQIFFSGLSLQLLKLLHNCKDHFHFYLFVCMMKLDFGNNNWHLPVVHRVYGCHLWDVIRRLVVPLGRYLKALLRQLQPE